MKLPSHRLVTRAGLRLDIITVLCHITNVPLFAQPACGTEIRLYCLTLSTDGAHRPATFWKSPNLTIIAHLLQQNRRQNAK